MVVTTLDSPEVDLTFKLFEQTTVADTVTYFTSRAELGTSDPVPVAIAGAEGVVFELNPESLVTLFSDENGAYPGEPGLTRVRIYVLDVAGRPLTIIGRYPDDSSAFESAGQPLLESIIWKDIS